VGASGTTLPIEATPANLSMPERLSSKFAECSTRSLLNAYGIALVHEHHASTPHDAAARAGELGYPVVLKAHGRNVVHKTELGFVRLDRLSGSEVVEAGCAMRAADTENLIEGFVVQPKLDAGVEVIVGMSVDPVCGPVIAVGPGGIMVELLNDVALGLPPLGRFEVEGMIDATRLGALLAGYRGTPPADREALVDLVLRFSALAGEQGERLGEIDLTPVIVCARGRGAWVVDAVVGWRGDVETTAVSTGLAKLGS